MSGSEHDLRNFSQIIGYLEGGQLNQDLTEEIRNVIATLHNEALSRGGKQKGSLTIKLDFLLEEGVIEVRADCSAKLPRHQRGRSMLWATPDNLLTAKNPKQTELNFKDVSSTPVRNVG